jgi:hypothetical protein
MMFLFLLAATQGMTAPQLGKPIGDISLWFNQSDFARKREGGAVRFKVLFTEDGTPERCLIEASTGNVEVEALACRRVQERFRFQPSSTSDGQPARRILVRSVVFGTGPFQDIRPVPAHTITLPGKGRTETIFVAVDVDRAGKLRGCGKTAKGKKQALVPGVCEQLAAAWKPMIETDSADRPVDYVRDLMISVQRVPS